MNMLSWVIASFTSIGFIVSLVFVSLCRKRVRQVRNDIDEIEKELNIKQQLYYGVVDNQPELVIRYLPDGTIIYTNKMFRDYIAEFLPHFNPEISTNIHSVFDVSKFMENIVGLTPDNCMLKRQHEEIDQHGNIRWQQWVHRAVFDAEGQIVEFQSVGWDITETKIVEEELHSYQTELIIQNDELRQAQNELEKSMRKYADLYDFAPIGYFSTDFRGKFLEINRTALEMLGLNNKFKRDYSFTSFLHADDKMGYLEHLKHAMYSGDEQTCEVRLVLPHLGGKVMYVSLKTMKHFYETGPQCRTAMMDITQLKNAIKALHENESRLNLALEAGNGAIWDWCFPTQTFNLSDRWYTMRGFDREDWNESNIWEQSIYPDDRERVKSEVEKHFTGMTEYYIAEYRTLTSDNNYRWILDRGKVIERDEEGRPLRMVGINMDIDDLKSAELALKNSRQRLDLAMETGNIAIWDYYPTINKTYFSSTWYSILEYDPYELPQNFSTWEDLLHPDDREISLKTVKDFVARRVETFEFEFRMRTKSGQWKWIISRGRVIEYDSDGEVYRIIGSHLDFTRIKEIESQLRSSNLLMNSIFKSFPDLISVINKNYEVVLTNWNSSLDRGGECQTGKCYEVFARRKNPCPYCRISDVFENGANVCYERTASEYDLTWEYRNFPILGENGEVSLVIEYKRDITSVRESERQLRESEMRFKTIFNNISDGICVFEWDGNGGKKRLIDCNNSYAQMSGYSKKELLQMEDLSAIQLVLDIQNSIFKLSESLDIEGKREGFYSWIRPDDKENIIEFTAAELKLETKSLLFGIDRDITFQRKAEDEIRFTSNYLESILDSMPSLIIGVDDQHRVVQWNNRSEIYLNIQREDAINKKLCSLTPIINAYHEMINRVIQTGVPDLVSGLIVSIEGKDYYFDLIVYPVKVREKNGAVIRMDDVTTQIRMEQMMVQTEKMMSVGGLAAGMAHEINNPLGIMLQGMDVILNRISTDSVKNRKVAHEIGLDLKLMEAYLENRQILNTFRGMKKAGERAAEIIRNMLKFSRNNEDTYQYVSISRIIEQTLEFLRKDYDIKKRYSYKQLDFSEEIEPDLPEIHCIENQIEQVLLNIFKNAIQAMMEWDQMVDKPKIMIRVYRQIDWMIIEIEDNGPGIDPEVKNRVFEPFFTTKDVGVGTGLGLSVSYFLIKNNHEGDLTFDSQIGKGTVFRITLPIKVRPRNGVRMEGKHE